MQTDIALISETHCVNTAIPKLPNFRSFSRNREKRSKGGVAIMVHNRLALDAVQVFRGEDENE